MKMKSLRKTTSQFRMCNYRICRVLFGVTSSPFLVTTAFKKHVETCNNEDSKFVEQFLRKLHIGDLNSGSENIQECYIFCNKAKARLKQASFNLWKF